MMVERHRYLDHSLQELSFRFRSGTPNVFEHFMRLEEGSTVKQFDSPQIELRIHTPFWHTGPQDVPGGPRGSHVSGRRIPPVGAAGKRAEGACVGRARESTPASRSSAKLLQRDNVHETLFRKTIRKTKASRAS